MIGITIHFQRVRTSTRCFLESVVNDNEPGGSGSSLKLRFIPKVSKHVVSHETQGLVFIYVVYINYYRPNFFETQAFDTKTPHKIKTFITTFMNGVNKLISL